MCNQGPCCGESLEALVDVRYVFKEVEKGDKIRSDITSCRRRGHQ